MKEEINLVKAKLKSLEEKLKTKEDLIKKFREALLNSNDSIQQITKDLEESLSLVREINQNLLPVELPQVPGFEFSYKCIPTQNGVSGDFFDVVKIQDTMNFAVLLSSCSSYAISSLFLSSFLKSTMYLKDYKTAGEFVSFVAKKLSSPLVKKEKVHLFYGIVSRSSFEMDYCLVGDVFAGYQSQEKDFQILNSSSPHLFEKRKSEFQGGKLILNPKDVLLLCSPGVVNQTNDEGQRFGMNNIIKAAQTKKTDGVLGIRQNVLFSCDQFSGNQVTRGDCTVLAVQATGKVLRVQKPSL